MQPVRVKIYGLIALTRRTYLIIQAVGLCIILALLAVGGTAMLDARTWLPRLGGLLGPRDLLGGLFWVGLVVLALEAVETLVVLRKFARQEALERARRSGLYEDLASRTGGADPRGLQQPAGLQPGERCQTDSES